MSLDTYTNLTIEIANWLNRQDLEPRIPTFVRMFEAQVERNPKIRTREMISRAIATLEQEFTILPLDFLALHNVQLNTNPVTPLYAGTMDDLDRIRRENPSGNVPARFCIVGDTLEVAPVPQAPTEIEIVYYTTLPKLSVDNPTNWLLEQHPDFYLYGSLLQSAPYLKNDDRIGVWLTAVAAIVEDIDLSNETATKGKGPINARLRKTY